jgi:hypothetical protein
MSAIRRRMRNILKVDNAMRAVAGVAIAGLIAACDDKGGNTSTEDTATNGSPTPAVCEFGAAVSGRYYPTSDEIEMRKGPGTRYGKVVNERATSVVGQTVYQTLSTTQVFEGHCVSDKWLEGKIVESGGSPVDWDSGWVLKQFLSSKMSDDQAAGLWWNISSETDFSEREKKILRLAALKVLRDNPNCSKVVDGYSATEEGSYFVTCMPRDGDKYFNVTFTLNDVTAGHTLTSPKPFPEAASRKLCEGAILGATTHPSTVEFYQITGYTTTEAANGNREIIQRFDAKNGFNLKLTYDARCLIMPSGKVEVAINEAR